MSPQPPGRAVLAGMTINVAGLYSALTRAPRQNEVVAILVARVQEVIDPSDRNALQGIDSTWADKVSQVFSGLLGLCPLSDITTQLNAAFTTPEGVTARRIRFNFARCMPSEYGPYAYSLAAAMLQAAAEASQDPDMIDAVTPATVSAITPLNGATAVPVNTTVTATFSEGMDATSFSTDSFVLANPAGAPVAATVTYDEVANKATLTPSSPLTSGVTYTARLRGGTTEPTVKDAQGVPLASDQTWPFTTA